jgi:hypothetical protein
MGPPNSKCSVFGLSMTFDFRLREDAFRLAGFFAGEESAAVVLFDSKDFVRVVVDVVDFVELFRGLGAGVGVPGEAETRLESALPFVAGVEVFFFDAAEADREGVEDCRLQ